MEAQRGEEASEDKSEASREWFKRFKGRRCLHKVKVQGEAESADIETIVSYPRKIQLKQFMKVAILNTKFSMQMKQSYIITVEEDASTTFTARQNSGPGFKASKDRD